MAADAPFDPYAILQVVPTCDSEVVHAAFRALAMKYHPDRDPSKRAERKMAELNRAYELLRDPELRARFDRARRVTIAGVSVAAGHGGPAPMPGRDSGSVLTFGRYTGWGLRDIARKDPDYLLWLSRHSSGIRYRTEIYGILRTMGVSSAA
jgi:curved DNA-binding protein CbpA